MCSISICQEGEDKFPPLILKHLRRQSCLDTSKNTGMKVKVGEKTLGHNMLLLSTHLLVRQRFHKVGNDVLGSSQWLMSSPYIGA